MSYEPTIDGRILAQVHDYPSFLAALRDRAAERQITLSSDQTHQVAGLSDRRLTQLLSIKTLQSLKTVRRVGFLSLGPLLGVLGVRLIMVADEEALRRYGPRLQKRNESFVRSRVTHLFFSRKQYSEMGKKGGKARNAKLTPEQRSELARELNRIRWSKPRVAQVDSAAAKKLQDEARP